jgi:predicted porin
MKKTLLTLAVLGTVSTVGTAAAQTNVSIYGIVDAGLVRESGGPAGSLLKLTSGIANGSRIGLRGVEDLGGGLSAFFTLENGFNADTGTLGQGGLLFGRQAFAGLEGAWGNLRLGRQYTPIDTLAGTTDPFGIGTAGRLTNVFAAGYVSRVNNMVRYGTPLVNGFSGDLSWGLGETPGNSAANRYVGVSAGYAAGPLYVRLAFQESNNPAANGSARNSALGVTYNFGPATAHFAWGCNKTDAGGAVLLDTVDAMLGISVPTTSGKLLASYTRRDDRSALNRDAAQFGLGYLHFLSKRTTLYTALGRIDNRNGAAYTVGGAIETGSGDRAWNLGLRHLF